MPPHYRVFRAGLAVLVLVTAVVLVRPYLHPDIAERVVDGVRMWLEELVSV